MYKDGRKKGNPTHIEFVIVPGPLGIEREQDRKRHGQVQSVISSLTKWCPDIKPYEVVELAKEVQDDWLDDFCNFAYDDVRHQVEKTQPDHVAEYVITMLSNWIKDRQMAAERKRIEDQRQYELFERQEAESKWPACFAEISASIPVTSSQLYFCDYGNAEIKGVVRKTITLWIVNEAFISVIESKENLPAYEGAIRKYYGQIAVQYKLIR